jgi:hypothetical protein
MSDPDARSRREAADRRVALFFGWLMIVAGVLIGGVSGLCILVFTNGGGGELAGVAWAIGGVPFVFGVVMFVCGIIVIVRLARRPAPSRENLAATFSDDPPEEPR